MWNPKPVTFRSKAYLDFVKSLSCCVNHECFGDVVAHHTTCGGKSLKGPDTHAISLCHKHHDEHDHVGKISFYLKHNLDRWQCVARTLEKFVIHKLNQGGKYDNRRNSKTSK